MLRIAPHHEATTDSGRSAALCRLFLPQAVELLAGHVLPFRRDVGTRPAFLIAIAATWAMARWAKARQMRTGQQFHTILAGIGLLIGLPLLVWLAGGAPLAMSRPELKGFNFAGGAEVLPEFFALLVGLTIYTATFIAEIVRAGILAVNKGQSEAAAALGLRPGTAMRLVILPQALRVIIPPMTEASSR